MIIVLVLLAILYRPIHIVLHKKYPHKGLFGLCMPCLFSDSSNKTSHPKITHNPDSENPQDSLDMEDVFKAIKDLPGVKRSGEDLKSVIQNAKRSTAHRAALAHKLDSEFIPSQDV